MDGFLNMLKPTGMTSQDMVSRVKKILNVKKVGHTGTLDPNVAGVLPICIGKATRLSEYIMEKKKTYRCLTIFGKSTDTYDSYGEVIEEKSDFEIKKEDVEEVLKSFVGVIRQVPPMYSALRVNGKRLYELAREGESLDLEFKARDISIYRCDPISIENDRVMFDVECSKGTYVRSLSKDLGDILKVPSYMGLLIRLGSGSFFIDEAITLEELEHLKSEGRENEVLLPMDFPLEKYQKVILKDNYLKYYENGNLLGLNRYIWNVKLEVNDIVKVYDKNDNFLGLGEIIEKDDRLQVKPKRNL